MSAPDFMPVLSRGGHDGPWEGACAMEYISLLAGESWSDTPDCTHPVLARCAQVVNDRLSDEDRHLLVPLFGRLMGTAPTGSPQERRVLTVRLAVWAAKRVCHLVPPEGREFAEALIATAEAWSEGEVTAEECRVSAVAASVGIHADAYTAATSAATAAAAAVYACGGDSVANTFAASCAADAAVYAASAATRATDDATEGLALLVGLCDEYDRLTGRPAAPEIATADLTGVAARVG